MLVVMNSRRPLWQQRTRITTHGVHHPTPPRGNLSQASTLNNAINAIVVFDVDAARARSSELDALRESGAPLGPLHGLPLTIKNHPPACLPIGPDSELLVTQLHSAGAVIFGYTNVPVNASDWQTYNPAYGTTNNPWDHGRTPGA